MSDRILLTATRHDCWANVQLIAFCSDLSPAQLAWTVPGTYGSIHATLQHIVGAEQGYLRHLTGEFPPRGPFTPGQALVALDELRERARSNAERMERHLASDDDPSLRIEWKGENFTAAVVAAQFVHHGSDHRTHMETILGGHGVSRPELDLDVWMYGVRVGELILPPPQT